MSADPAPASPERLDPGDRLLGGSRFRRAGPRNAALAGSPLTGAPLHGAAPAAGSIDPATRAARAIMAARLGAMTIDRAPATALPKDWHGE